MSTISDIQKRPQYRMETIAYMETDVREVVDRRCHRTPVEERFLRFVGDPEENGCILWKGSVSNKGYGQINSGGRNGRPLRAHRVAWEVANGKIRDGMWVLHRCDNRLCVNPDHLFLGTSQDNVDDAVRKKRHAHGDTHGFSKVRSGDVAAIRQRYSNGGVSQSELASEFGLCQQSICDIVNHVNWKNSQ